MDYMWNCKMLMKNLRFHRLHLMKMILIQPMIMMMMTHTGGSRSAYEHKGVIAKETGRVPSIPQLHVHMHTNKNDRTKFVDKKSKDIHDRFQAELERHRQEAEGGGEGSSSSQPIDEDELFLSLDEVKESQYYRIGSASGSYQATTQRTRRRRPSISSLGGSVVAEMQAKLEAQEAELAEMREFKARSQKQAEEMARNQARLEGSIARMIATLPAKYRPPTEGEDDEYVDSDE